MHQKVEQWLGPPEQRAERARERRRSELRAMRSHFQRGADIPPPVREALRKHARRSARLLRIRVLAEAAGDKASIARCDQLIALERTRHHARMAQLLPKSSAAPGAAEPDEGDEDEIAPEEEGAEEQP
jgi:hypothetical protein